MKYAASIWLLAPLAGVACAAAGSTDPEQAPALLPMTRAEQMALGAEHRREYTFERIDADDDGVISVGEWASQNWAHLVRFDADHNNMISPIEFATAVCPVPQAGQLRSTDLHCISGRTRRLRELDKSEDGRLSEAEYGPASLDYFRQADLCRDNVLSREELNGDVRRRRVSCEQLNRPN